MESVVLIVADDSRQSPPQIADVLCNDNAVFPEKTADLIDEPDAVGNQATANPMNRLHRQLFGGLDRHEAHVRSAYRLANRLRIIPIVLVRLHIGRDKLRTDESDVVPKVGKRLRPKVRAVRCLQADKARRQVCEER
jgi:hypothetical protein